MLNNITLNELTNNIKYPFIRIYGRRGSGKSNLIRNIYETMKNNGYEMNKTIVVTNEYNVAFYKLFLDNVYTTSDNLTVEQNCLVIFDDVHSSSSYMAELYCNGRHHKCTVIVASQHVVHTYGNEDITFMTPDSFTNRNRFYVNDDIFQQFTDDELINITNNLTVNTTLAISNDKLFYYHYD